MGDLESLEQNVQSLREGKRKAWEACRWWAPSRGVREPVCPLQSQRAWSSGPAKSYEESASLSSKQVVDI